MPSLGRYCKGLTGTGRGQSYTLTPWPVTQPLLAQHVELTVTRDTRHAQRQALLIRPGPSHSQQPAVHHSPQPASLAAARVTRSGPPSPAAACRNLPRAVTVVTRRGPPSLAAARLNRRCPGTRRGPSHSDGAAAARPAFARHSPPHWLSDSPLPLRQSRSLSRRSDLKHPDHHIWNTLIAILCLLFIYEFIYEFIFWVFTYVNSYMSSYMNNEFIKNVFIHKFTYEFTCVNMNYLWICIWIHI